MDPEKNAGNSETESGNKANGENGSENKPKNKQTSKPSKPGKKISKAVKTPKKESGSEVRTFRAAVNFSKIIEVECSSLREVYEKLKAERLGDHIDSSSISVMSSK